MSGGSNHTDRAMPHSAEAEMAVLGALLLDPAYVMPLCRDALGLDSFHDVRHQTIYGAMLAMPVIDPMLLTQRLTDTGKLDAAGGAVYVTDLLDKVPTAAYAESYIEVVHQKHQLRRFIVVGDDIMRQAYGDVTDVPAFSDSVEKSVLAVTTAGDGKDAGRDMRAGAGIFMDRLAARLDTDRHGVTGLETGLGKLDKLLTGLHPLLYLICARPSMGKTVLLVNMALHLALNGTPTAIFSLEMSLEELMERAYASLARVSSMALRTGQITVDDHQRVLDAHKLISVAPLTVDDTPGLSILELRRRARRFVRQRGVKALFIDYAQLIACTSKKAEQNEIWGMNEVSAGLKNLQRELQVPVIAAAQLNRENEKRENTRPRLSDIGRSGAMEQDADTVLLLHRPGKDNKDDKAERQKAELIIAKQRHGPLSSIPLTFLEEHYQFVSAAE